MNVVSQIEFDNFRQQFYADMKFHQETVLKLQKTLTDEVRYSAGLQSEIHDLKNRFDLLLEQFKPLLSPIDYRKLNKSWV